MIYSSINQKELAYKSLVYGSIKNIDTVDEFEKIYQQLSENNNEVNQFFYRGMPEAKYTLMNSAQRAWNAMKIRQWNDSENYRSFFYKILERIKKEFLLKKVMDFYTVTKQFEFSLLSLIQHYGGYTPLLDWSYDLNVALYFAIINQHSNNFLGQEDINQYCSLYIIDNTHAKLQSLAEDNSFKEAFESVRDRDMGANRIFYFSDFDRRDSDRPPLTSVFNQNIIPQKGLFIFNPSRTTPIETYLLEKCNDAENAQGFTCYNINKGLSEYIQRKIASQGYNKDFIFPDLNTVIHRITEDVLNSYFVKGKM